MGKKTKEYNQYGSENDSESPEILPELTIK